MLELSSEKVAFIIIKARQFDVKVEPGDPDWASNAADDGMSEVLEETGSDATQQELESFIGALNEEEQINLVALTWLGRGDDTKEGWDDLIGQARDAHNEHTAGYLHGIPLLSDYLEEGLSELGYSIEDFEMGRL